jgi:hypothetical protein
MGKWEEKEMMIANVVVDPVVMGRILAGITALLWVSFAVLGFYKAWLTVGDCRRLWLLTASARLAVVASLAASAITVNKWFALATLVALLLGEFIERWHARIHCEEIKSIKSRE